MTHNKIYFNPETQYENTGDLLINKVLVETIGNYGTVYIDDHGKPASFINDLKFPHVKKLSEITDKSAKGKLLEELLKVRFSAKKNDEQFYYLLIPGHVERKGFADLKKQLKAFANLLLLSALGCKIIRIGVSYGNFATPNKFMEALSSNLYYRLAVRENSSLRFAQNSNFKNVVLTPDLAWGYQSSAQTFQEPFPKKNVVLSFRANAYGTKHDDAYIQPVADRIKYIIKNSDLINSKIIICYQVAFDRQASIQLYNLLKEDFENIELVDKCLNLSEADALYSTAKCLLSNRLHVLMLGIRNDSLSVPLIKKTDNKKIYDIYLDNNMGEQILDLAETPDKNLRQLSTILESGKRPTEHYKERSKTNLGALNDVFSSIFGRKKVQLSEIQ